MTIDGGWICRTCWKTNRPSDRRCYRCHTPRTADDATIGSQRGAKPLPASKDAGDALDLLVALPAVVFSWFWRLYVLGGILFLGLSVLIAINDRAPQFAWVPAAGVAGGAFLLAVVMRWASSAMRARNPWAYFTALAVSLGIGGFTWYALNNLPAGTGNPDWMRYATLAIFGFTALLAAVGLMLSLAGDDGQPS